MKDVHQIHFIIVNISPNRVSVGLFTIIHIIMVGYLVRLLCLDSGFLTHGVGG